MPVILDYTNMDLGWINNQREVERIRETSAGWFPSVSFAMPGISTSDKDYKDTFLWDAERMVLGKLLDAFLQTLGTCVSQGWARFLQDQILIDIAIRKKPNEWIAGVATEPIYAGSRIEIGGGQLGGGQGSIGAWAAEWCRRWGVLFRMKYDQFDLTIPNDNLAHQWGTSRDGVPFLLENIAKERPISAIAPVYTVNEARSAICTALTGIPICSNVGFTNTRDNQGFDYRGRKPWGHCMYTRGYFTAKGNRPAFIIQQSWGNQPYGPNKIYCESGEVRELPQGCFAVDVDIYQQILNEKDSFTGSGVKGFIRRRLDWSQTA